MNQNLDKRTSDIRHTHLTNSVPNRDFNTYLGKVDLVPGFDDCVCGTEMEHLLL